MDGVGDQPPAPVGLGARHGVAYTSPTWRPSPSTRLYARGLCSAPVDPRVFRPSRLDSSRALTSVTDEPSRTIEFSISQRSTDAVADRRVGADEGVRDLRVPPDDGGPADRARADPRARSITTLPLDPRRRRPCSSIARRERVQHDPVRFQHVLELAGVLPPPARCVRWTAARGRSAHWMASVISSSPRAARPDALDGVEDRVVEHVDADERQVGAAAPSASRRAGRRLAPQLGHAELLGVRDPRQQDLGVAPRSRRGSARRASRASPDQVVPEVHDEGLPLEGRPRR